MFIVIKIRRWEKLILKMYITENKNKISQNYGFVFKK